MKITILFIFLAACFVSGRGVKPSTPSTASDDSEVIYSSWIINNEIESEYFDSLTSVQEVSSVTLSGNSYVQVECTGIPQYDHEITQSDIDWLDYSRPKADTDFINGKTNVSLGEIVEFGQSIGYQISNHGCELGYWPPGPSCPVSSDKIVNFPLNPVQSSNDCYTTLNKIGLWVNGVSVYDWWDGTSYEDEDTWHTMAAFAEFYDLDICSGHSNNAGDYHHHTFPNCLQKVLNDTGSDKSPIYGFAADGYPILGPWVREGVLAQSCWKDRDYEDPSSLTGCGVPYKRTCLLVDQYDISQGTMVTLYPGPDTNSNVTTQSGNNIQASVGYFFEDHYYDPDCTDQGDEYLDQYNGRLDETYGYVYHTTIADLDNPEFYTSVFPHFIGPTFYGQLDTNTVVQCNLILSGIHKLGHFISTSLVTNFVM